jgi:hypothetical protein
MKMDDEAEILNLYSTEKLSLKKIANKVGRSSDYVSLILKNAGVYEFSDGSVAMSKREFVTENGFKFVAKCKKTGNEFDDFENRSGILLRHIENNFKDVPIPSSFKRRSYMSKHGKFWHEQFLDIIKIPDQNANIVYKKCRYCDWETKDLDNKSGAYTTHLNEYHTKTIDNYVSEFPEESFLFKTHFNKKELQKLIESSPENHISCLICGEKMKKITNSHLKNKHGISLMDYKISYSTGTLSESSKKIMVEKYDTTLRHYEHKFSSKGQDEIFEFLNSLGLECKKNDKTILRGVEMDVVSFNKKIAVEYNGLLYHSELFGKKERMFHLNKTELAYENGFKLFHIFEDDWAIKKEIIKHKLRHIAGMNDGVVIGARKCEIKNTTTQMKSEFLDANHIQGNVDSEINVGAFFKGELVSVMTFDSKRRMTAHKINDGEYELNRFAVKNGIRIPGIAGKLLSSFIKIHSPKKIISFADRCWTPDSDNNLYTNLGFKLMKMLPPDYKYFSRKIHDSMRLHKFAFGKNALQKRYPEIYHPDKTEWQMMQEAGFDRIWDCGKFRYELVTGL